jgi:hypothetical protein
MGIWRAWAPHHALDCVLQDLRRFPGKGWPLIRAGLRSPVTRNRNMAAAALAAWPQDTWPAEATALVEGAIGAEPNEGTKKWLERLRDGRPLDDRE